MKIFPTLSISALAMLGAASLAGAALAQDGSQGNAQGNSQSASDLPENAACMAGGWRDVPQVKAAQRGQQFRILVAKSDVKYLEAQGFAEVDCKVSDFASKPKRTAWRDHICDLGSYGNEAVQNQLESAFGVRPAVLCGSAEMVAGQWTPRAKPQQD